MKYITRIPYIPLYGIVGFIINTPLWVDIILMLVILGLSVTVYCKLCHRDTFKPQLFTALILIPLGIPGIHMTGKLVRIGAVEIVQRGPFFMPKWSKEVVEQQGKHAARMIDEASHVGANSAKHGAKTRSHYPRTDRVAGSGYGPRLEYTQNPVTSSKSL